MNDMSAHAVGVPVRSAARAFRAGTGHADAAPAQRKRRTAAATAASVDWGPS